MTVTFSLDGNSINRAVKALDDYRRSMLNSVQDFMRQLIDQGVQQATLQIAFMDAIQTGQLIDSIEGYYDADNHVGFIRTTNDHALFVEFGTGIQGAENPYHGDAGDWQYDTNGHGQAGWYYFDGRTRWTRGMGSRPFMYNTAKALYEACLRV